MKVRAKSLAAVVGLGLVTLTLPAQAAPIFYDDFNSNLPSAPNATNVVPDGWTVTAGTGSVDLLRADNVWGIKCADDTSGCVDLDGTTGQAGLLSNGNFALQAGQQYQLTAMVSGNQRNSNPDSLFFGLLNASNSSILASNIVLNVTGSTFSTVSLLFTATSNVSARIFFQATGGDNVGPILDNVSLAAVPLPPAGWLLLSGLIGLVAVRRRGAA